MQVLTIMRVEEGTTMEELVPLFVSEATQAWEYYATGMVRTMHTITDSQGVVFLWEAPDVETVKSAVDRLPMMRAGFLHVEFIPLANYTGFEQLFATT